jgi:glyoxylase-like metal-dependent hydrolase (beta-lactamase superfamily II)
MNKTTFGSFNLYSIQTGHFLLDGGAMFGVVPKTLWARHIPADDNNRILMGARSLLIESPETGRLYLIDTGIGHKSDEKFAAMYGIDFSQFSLESQLNAAGFSIDDITDVIFTHLHFDHGGGATRWKKNDGVVYEKGSADSSGSGRDLSCSDGSEAELVFRKANHWVTRSHWIAATQPNAREKSSFLPENIRPLAVHDRLILTEGAHVFEDDFYTIIVNGHTPGQQLPVISDGERKLVFAADFIPTHAHVPLSWIMSYDMFPLTTIEERERLMPRAVQENWYLFMQHDSQHEVIQVHHDGRNFRMKESITLSDL